MAIETCGYDDTAFLYCWREFAAVALLCCWCKTAAVAKPHTGASPSLFHAAEQPSSSVDA